MTSDLCRVLLFVIFFSFLPLKTVRSPLGGSTSYRQLCPLSEVAGNDKDALMNSQLDLSLFCFFCTRPPSEDHVARTAVWGQRHAEGPLRL